MDYTLTILSSGRPVYLERTIRSFMEHVTPAPAEVYVFDDGASTGVALRNLLGPGAMVEGDPLRLGMCAAMSHCWMAAARSEHPYAFHIEDDMVFLRPTDLSRLAALLERQPQLAQLTLLRTPWGAEIEHGGYIAQNPGWYERRRDKNFEWIETTRNWANAPTLFRTDLAREVRWPRNPGCETTIGPLIRDLYPDGRFGIWGGGEPHVAHIGVARAPGSHGY